MSEGPIERIRYWGRFCHNRNQFEEEETNDNSVNRATWLISLDCTADSAGSGEKRDVFRELSKGAVFIMPGHGATTGAPS